LCPTAYRSEGSRRPHGCLGILLFAATAAAAASSTDSHGRPPHCVRTTRLSGFKLSPPLRRPADLCQSPAFRRFQIAASPLCLLPMTTTKTNPNRTSPGRAKAQSPPRPSQLPPHKVDRPALIATPAQSSYPGNAPCSPMFHVKHRTVPMAPLPSIEISFRAAPPRVCPARKTPKQAFRLSMATTAARADLNPIARTSAASKPRPMTAGPVPPKGRVNATMSANPRGRGAIALNPPPPPPPTEPRP